jgi:hypothetical protein
MDGFFISYTNAIAPPYVENTASKELHTLGFLKKPAIGRKFLLNLVTEQSSVKTFCRAMTLSANRSLL